MIEDISRIISGRDFSKFIGLKEDLWLEVKGKNPYQLELPSGRYELAKDSSALANAAGGYLLIGFLHERLQSERAESISGLEMIRESEFDCNKYEGIIQHHVHPSIENLTISWQESANVKDMGIGVICVPPQKEERKYFVITRGAMEDGEELKNFVLGLVIRQGSSNLPFPPKDIYTIIRNGRSDIVKRVMGIEETLNGIGKALFVIDRNIMMMAQEISKSETGEQHKPVSFDKLYDAIKKVTEENG